MAATGVEAVGLGTIGNDRIVPNDDFVSPRVNVRFREYLEGD
jgi:hypothetical protein